MKKVSVALAFAAMAAFAQPVFAQAVPTIASVTNGCAAGGDCAALVRAYIATRPGGVLNAQQAAALGRSLGNLGLTNPALAAQVSAALNVASAAAPAAQSTQLASLATAVSQGDTFDTADLGDGGSEI